MSITKTERRCSSNAPWHGSNIICVSVLDALLWHDPLKMLNEVGEGTPVVL